ncbi:MAG TPA: iron-sulfur cluster biosynthesis family protein [Candidatus Gracilibacteria bacterium]
MSKSLQFTGSEIIGDILGAMPEASEILASHGVACASCHINAYETLEQGILGHGFGQDTLDDILQDLNEAAADMGLTTESTKKNPPTLTTAAANKIRDFQKSQHKEGFGFRIEVTDFSLEDPGYFLDLEEKPDKEDHIINSQEVQLWLSPDSYRFLQNKTIDYVETKEDAGFKIA